MKYLEGNRYSLKNLVKIKSRKSFWSVLFFLYSGYFAADIYLFKVNNGNTGTIFERYSELTIKIPE